MGTHCQDNYPQLIKGLRNITLWINTTLKFSHRLFPYCARLTVKRQLRTKSSSGLTSSNASKGSRFSSPLIHQLENGDYSSPQSTTRINFCRQYCRRCVAVVKCAELKNVRLLFASVLHHIRSGCLPVHPVVLTHRGRVHNRRVMLINLRTGAVFLPQKKLRPNILRGVFCCNSLRTTAGKLSQLLMHSLKSPSLPNVSGRWHLKHLIINFTVADKLRQNHISAVSYAAESAFGLFFRCDKARCKFFVSSTCSDTDFSPDYSTLRIVETCQ